MRHFSLLFVLIALHTAVNAQPADSSKPPVIDLSIFSDAAHHWYDINEKGAVILPLPGHPQYKPTEITAIADNIVLFQKDNGGWPKNYDMQAILTADQLSTTVPLIPISLTWQKCIATPKQKNTKPPH